MNPTLKLVKKNRDDILSVAELLYGDGAWEISKALTQQQKRERTQARVGLASNVVGITAGTAGLGAALKDDRLKDGGKVARRLYKVGTGIESAAKRTKAGSRYYNFVKKPKVAAGMAVGAVALQGANLAGDGVSNRVLSRSAKGPNEIHKGMFRSVKSGYQKASKLSDDMTHLTGKLNKLTSKKSVAATAGGTAAVIGGSSYAGSYYGTKNGTKAGRKELSKAEVPDVEWRGEISKMDTEKRQVFGWASIVEVNGEPVVDLQGDYMSLDEIEKAAYTYVQKSRRGGNQHEKGSHVSDMIESFLVTPDKKEKLGLPADMPTGWWVGFQVNDDATWQQVKNGERREFSIHGSGIRKDIEL
jgi:hypothetical protein